MRKCLIRNCGTCGNGRYCAPQRTTRAGTPPQNAASSPQSLAPSPKLLGDLWYRSVRAALGAAQSVTTRKATPAIRSFSKRSSRFPSKVRILIPAGTYVQGEIQEANAPAK